MWQNRRKERRLNDIEVNQVEMVMLDNLVCEDHPYRRLKTLLDFDRIQRSVKVKESEFGANGYGKKRLVM